jgi:ubiquinone/menaquinone biosynthesis C-methylase UbiE
MIPPEPELAREGPQPVSLHHMIEHVIHRLRYRQVDPFVTRCETMADLGCGQRYRFLRSHHDKAERCWGLDITVADGEDGNITLKKWDITGPLPFQREAIDQITILAVLEHIPNPRAVLSECHRVMTSGARIIITTPSKLGIKVHDIMRGLRLVQDVEEGEHVDFSMSKSALTSWAEEAGFRVEVSRQFEMGLNLLLVARK